MKKGGDFTLFQGRGDKSPFDGNPSREMKDSFPSFLVAVFAYTAL